MRRLRREGGGRQEWIREGLGTWAGVDELFRGESEIETRIAVGEQPTPPQLDPQRAGIDT